MEAVLDNHFPLSYRDQVLNFLYPLFPSPTMDSKSPYIHSLTRLLVTLSNPALTVSLLESLVPKDKLVAYQLAFDLVEGGAQDFLETIRNDLPMGDEVLDNYLGSSCSKPDETRLRALFLRPFARFWVDANL
jgi:26S proteasome regulatory subunit N2